jgi:hypothetical protein
MNKSRLFQLEWNNSKMPNLVSDQRFRKCTAEGVHFANGIVVLDTSVVFETMTDLKHHLTTFGSMKLAYRNDNGDLEPVEEDQESKEPSRIPSRRSFRAVAR